MYRSETVVADVKRRLASKPTASLGALSADLGMDRHTISRKLKAAGVTFGQLKANCIRDEIRRLQRDGPSNKEVATRLGCSGKTAARWIRSSEEP